MVVAVVQDILRAVVDQVDPMPTTVLTVKPTQVVAVAVLLRMEHQTLVARVEILVKMVKTHLAVELKDQQELL